MRRKLAVLILALAVAVPAWAQTLFQGRIDVTVLDSQGRAVPGALVEITGPTPQSQATDDAGEAHFLNLPPGNYTVTATLRDSAPIPTIALTSPAGRSVPLKITLQVSGVAEAVQVAARAARRRSGTADHDDQRVVR